MPNIFIKVPGGVFDAVELDNIARGVSDAACAAEGIPDNPDQRMLTWVMIEEIKAGHVFSGGQKIVPDLIPVVVQFHAPEKVLDEDRRVIAADGVHTAIVSAVNRAKQASILTSCMLLDVPDGHWGAQGQIWMIGQFAQAAGYEHLQHLVD